MKHSNEATQLSLFSDPDPVPQLPEGPFEVILRDESVDAFKLRRTAEMAEKLGWPALVIKPIRQWPGLAIPHGEEAWHELLDHTPREIGLIMLALYGQLEGNSINGDTGLYHKPVESLSQIEERCRSKLIQIAQYLEWPRISCWIAGTAQVFGPGENVWRKYAVYGGFGLVSDAVGALERRLRGEPDRVQKTAHKQMDDDDEDEV